MKQMKPINMKGCDKRKSHVSS